MTPREVISSYMLGIFFGLITVMFLSFIGILPIHPMLLSYGFMNPNTLAFYIMIVNVSYVYLNWNLLKSRFYILYFLSIFFVWVQLDSTTPALAMILFLLLNIIFNNKKSKLFVKFTSFLPLITFFFSLFLGEMYGKFSWIAKLNIWLSDRVNIWNYYLGLYPVRLLPKARSYYPVVQNFNSNSLNNGASSFDGAYIYNLLSQGLILTIILLLLLSFSVYFLGKEGNMPLVCVFFVLIIYSFSETITLSFGSYFQCYLISLSIIIVFLGNRSKRFSISMR